MFSRPVRRAVRPEQKRHTQSENPARGLGHPSFRRRGFLNGTYPYFRFRRDTSTHANAAAK